jgi:hypothetical protein
MCRLSWNLESSFSWNPQGLPRPVMGLLYLYSKYRVGLDSIACTGTCCSLSDPGFGAMWEHLVFFFTYSSGQALVHISPHLYWLSLLLPRVKATGIWPWPPISIEHLVQGMVEIYPYRPLCHLFVLGGEFSLTFTLRRPRLCLAVSWNFIKEYLIFSPDVLKTL